MKPSLTRKDFLRAATAALGAVALPATRAAAKFPERPLKLVVPFSAGGTADVLARVVAQHWSPQLGQSIVIENKGGAGGNLGAELVAKAPADGYTLLYGSVSNFAMNLGLYKKLPYAPLTDFAPVGMVLQIPIVLVASPALGVKDFEGFIKLLKAHPGKYNYGSAGNGSSAHIACHLLLRQTGTEAVHVPYKGNAAALQDIMAGSVALGVASVTAAEALVRAGKLQALAAISTTRLPAFAQLPTTRELGLKDYDAYSWNAIAAPAGTPVPVLDTLNQTLRQALRGNELRAALDKQGVVPLPDYTREATAAYFKAQVDKWVPIVRASGAQVD